MAGGTSTLRCLTLDFQSLDECYNCYPSHPSKLVLIRKVGVLLCKCLYLFSELSSGARGMGDLPPPPIFAKINVVIHQNLMRKF